MEKYLWEDGGWQEACGRYDRARLLDLMSRARFLQGEVLGKVSALDLRLQGETEGEVLTAEVMETSRIEGVELNIASVRSSVAERLGFPAGVGRARDLTEGGRHTEGVVDVLIDAVRNCQDALTLTRLSGWHAALFPLGYAGIYRINAGALRRGGIQVVSGRIGAEKVHFEGPPAGALKKEMSAFLKWFNASRGVEDGLLRAAAAHLKFVTIHPYGDGNGRLGRAITDMAMAQDEAGLRAAPLGFRAYSLSAEIMRERRDYYAILERVQRLEAEVTEWYRWFLQMFINALGNAGSILAAAFFKAAFWNRIKDIELSERQQKVIRKVLDAGPGGFEGGLTTRKYAGLTDVSKATASRELADMLDKGVLRQTGQGRSVRYDLDG